MESTVDQQTGFESFYRVHRLPLLRAVTFTLGDRDLAADVVDEAFVRAYSNWNEVAAIANAPGWTYRVAMNLASNRRRRRSLERRKPVVFAPNEAHTTIADPAIGRALRRLPLEQRAVVVMRFHLDWSTEQMAEALGVPPGTVKSRLSRALRRLAALLEVPE